MKPLPLFLLLTIAALTAAPATAQHPEQQFDPTDWFDVLARDVTRDEVTRLALSGVDVQSVHGNEALLYLPTKRIAELRAQGFNLTQLPRVGGTEAHNSYHTYADLTADLQAIAAAHPSICQLSSIGTSVQGRELWFMKISDNVGVEEDEPEFRYISSMHGDEVVGIEMCMNLIELITNDYGIDPRITSLVDDVEIWIMPMMNPDGTTARTRYNAQGYNLNREFPDRVNDPVNTTTGRPREVQLVMNWSFAHSPVLSANFHGGALVVNFPYDSDPNPWTSYSACPDDDVFTQQSLTYSRLNTPMYNSRRFSQGITNGAAWYVIYGGLQDWSYVWQGCNDVTIELDDAKWPPYSRIAGLWNDNRAAMLAYMELCLEGVRGVVTDVVTGAPLAATVQVTGRNHDVFTDPDIGDYHRMLLPGTYSLTYSAPGYVPQTVTGITVSGGDASRVDVALVPVGFNPPAPNIDINGLNGPLTNPAGTPISITVSLAPGDLQGVPHDWWVRATDGTSTFWWYWPSDWYLAPIRCYNGGLFPLPAFQIAAGYLPVGTWTFTFAVDPLDGSYQGTYSDSVTITSY